MIHSTQNDNAYAEMVELVDTPGLEPGAVRCAGSSPVLGKTTFEWKNKKKIKKVLKYVLKSLYIKTLSNPG